MSKTKNKKKKMSSFKIIVLGFAGLIVLGALILMLPVSSRSGAVTPFNEALFTSVSSVCVTGLVVQDTGSYWSSFGQAVILLLIQIGGLGVVTVAVSFAMLSGRKISLMQRSTMQDSISAPKVGGIVRLTKFILLGTFIVELIGAIAMLPVFIKDYGLKGIWMSVFHSVTAFCNAGFDIMGTQSNPFVSITEYSADPVINITVMILIIVGGIGFLTWYDIIANKFKVKRYRLQSKIILLTSMILILLPAIYFFVFDYSDLTLGKRLLASLFQSVTPRTAGFNTTDISQLSGASKGIMVFLMLIGGSPGSTAGGMKTTTIAVLIMNALSTFRRKEDTEVFGRRIDSSIVKNASTLLVMYISLALIGSIIISSVENLPFTQCLFETASAVGTVGLTLGITPYLGIVSQIILMLLMFLGRVGGLTFIYATVTNYNLKRSKLPLEKITVG